MLTAELVGVTPMRVKAAFSKRGAVLRPRSLLAWGLDQHVDVEHLPGMKSIAPDPVLA